MNRIIRIIPLMILAVASVKAEENSVGKSLFNSRCASCHGILGEADGPVGKAMPPGTITNLKRGPFKFAVDEAKTKELITKGGAALGLSPLMSPQSGISDGDLSELAQYVMSLKS